MRLDSRPTSSALRARIRASTRGSSTPSRRASRRTGATPLPSPAPTPPTQRAAPAQRHPRQRRDRAQHHPTPTPIPAGHRTRVITKGGPAAPRSCLRPALRGLTWQPTVEYRSGRLGRQRWRSCGDRRVHSLARRRRSVGRAQVLERAGQVRVLCGKSPTLIGRQRVRHANASETGPTSTRIGSTPTYAGPCNVIGSACGTPGCSRQRCHRRRRTCTEQMTVRRQHVPDAVGKLSAGRPSVSPGRQQPAARPFFTRSSSRRRFSAASVAEPARSDRRLVIS